jgi:hypothetical protein
VLTTDPAITYPSASLSLFRDVVENGRELL